MMVVTVMVVTMMELTMSEAGSDADDAGQGGFP